jgi:1L-myo-inositol 1-phosphate cytidylyltransferase
VRFPSTVPARDAVILAAGNGDRFKFSPHHSKLLHPVLGQPLLLRTLESVAAAGISAVTVVLGYEADRVREVIERHRLPGVRVRFAFNPAWHLENGVSVLAARQFCAGRRFALLMGDHLFEARVLEHLATLPVAASDSLLAIDRSLTEPALIAEATKVQLDGDRIVAIGKSLERWDAIDTGLFVFTPAIFDALDAAVGVGQTTLSAGVQRLAEQRLMRGVEVGGATWFDIDTVEDLETAESLLGTADVVAEPA